MTPVDTSAEAVRLHEHIEASIQALSCGNWESNCMCGRCNERRELQLDYDAQRRERADLESLLAERNRQNAAAFTASDAYQKRCEQGDALLREALDDVDYAESNYPGADERRRSERIMAHLAGEDMGRKL